MLNLIFFAVFGALSLVGILLWAQAIKRINNRQCIVDPLGERDLVGSPLGLIDVFVVFFAWFGGQLIAAGLALFILNVPFDEITSLEGELQAKFMGIVGAGQLVLTLGVLVIIWVRYQSNLSSISVKPKFVFRDVLLGFASFVMVIPFILLLQWVLALLVPYEHASLNMLTKDASVMTFAWVWFTAGIVAPITEEVVFRGFIQAFLQRLGRGRGRMNLEQIFVGGWDGSVVQAKKPEPEVRPEETTGDGKSEAVENESAVANPYQSPLPIQNESETLVVQSWYTNSWWPILATSGFFAFMHIGQGAAPIPLFVFACVLGYLFQKTGSILPCIVLHMLLNVFSLFWYTVNVFFGVVPEPTVAAPKVACLLDCWFW